jgi:3-oxoadipate enol-lactonase
MKLHYEITSVYKERPWLILINGLFASLKSWDDSVLILKEHFQILRYDCRGQGQSPSPDGVYYLQDNVQDLIELMNDLEIDHAHLLGISNGGRIALSFAENCPERTISVVAADTYAHVSSMIKIKLNSWLVANEIGGAELRFSTTMPWIFGETYINTHQKEIEIIKTNAMKAEKRVINNLIKGSMDGDINLDSITSPVLLLVGDEDLLTPPSLHYDMHSKLKHGNIAVIEGGHASLLESTTALRKNIIPYLEMPV